MAQSACNPLVSIIIPAYNYGRFLADTLGSIISQTYTQWECIVIDDGSTDDTRQVVEGFAQVDSRIKYVYQDNAGPSAARNAGIGHATGSFFQFLDADDLLECRKLELHVAYLKENSDTGIVYGDMRYFPDDEPTAIRYSLNKDNQPWMPKISGEGIGVLQALLGRNIMVISSPLLRRSVVERCGYFDEDLESHEDWDYWIRCAIAGTYFSYADLPGSLSLIRVHSRSLSINYHRMLRTLLKVRMKIKSLLSDKSLYNQNISNAVIEGVELSLLDFANGNRLSGTIGMIKYAIIGKRYDLVPYAFKLALVGR